MVEFQPSKLAVVGSNPIARSIDIEMCVMGGMQMMDRKAHVAQLAEHVLGKDEVTRSIRVVGSMRDCVGRRVASDEGRGF